MTTYQRFMRKLVGERQLMAQAMLDVLPDRAENNMQRALQKKHGTPREFAENVLDTLGEISWDETCDAIRKYYDEWKTCEEITRRMARDQRRG